MKPKTVARKIWKKTKDVWNSLDYVPNCRVCNGTGRPTDYMSAETVFWKGEEVIVCSSCRGRGKV